MAEEGLKAFHKITKNINNQDERIWRQTSAKKCLKKEIEKVEEQTKQYELQIATLKKDPLYKKHEEFSQILGDNIKEHLQIHKLISLSISAKNEEVERKEKEIKSWDKKYMEALADLQDAYEMKRTLLDSTDPTYKKLTDLKSAQKIAQVWLKQLKASSKRRQKGIKQLEMIKEKIFHKIITNFTSAVLRKREYVEKSAKFKELEEKKKKMVRELFEAQEALKKLRVRHTQIPSGMFTRRVPNLQPPRTVNKSDGRMTDSSSDINKLKRISTDQNKDPESEKKDKEGSSTETEYKEPLTPPTPKKKSKLPLNRLNIISNKIVSLPPLKSILSRQRSRMDTSFNRSLDTSNSFRGSQNSQVSSHANTTKEAESTPRCSQEERSEPEKISNLPEIQNTVNNNGKEAQSSKIMDPPKPSDYLKNLKFTSQSSKFQMPKIKSPIRKQNSILKSQASKRSLNESLQDGDLDSSQRKREKNVNFASPIHQQFDINQTLSSNEANMDLSSPMNTTSNMSNMSNMNMSGFLDDNVTTMIAPNYDGFTMGNSQFSFGPNDDDRSGTDQGNMPNMAPMSIFGSTTDTGPSFGFSFGGASKSTGEMWDLFS